MHSGRRIEDKMLARARPLLEIIEKLLPGERMILAIDGRCGSGKTTLAGILSRRYGATVVHMDDFYLPASLRTKERYEQPGGNVHYERLLDEVIPGLRGNTPIRYRKFDPSIMDYGAEVEVLPSALMIVEGSYSLCPKLHPFYDFRLFLDLSEEEQSRRILLRNGKERHRQFLERWIPLEERYFQAYAIRDCCDLLLHMDE